MTIHIGSFWLGVLTVLFVEAAGIVIMMILAGRNPHD